MVALALVSTIGVLLAAGGGILWTRPLWFDEICCTLFVAEGASSPFEIVQRVARGEDYAPPLLHLMTWGAGKLAGGLTPIVLRSTSLLCVGGAIVLLYLALRRRFDRAPGVAGVLAVATHSLVIAHAFEARFYGPWLLFASAYAWTLGLDSASERSRRREAAQAIASVALVTIHWFGVLALGVMASAAVLSRGSRWRNGLRLVAPSAMGLVALAACIPLVCSFSRQCLCWRSCSCSSTRFANPDQSRRWGPASGRRSETPRSRRLRPSHCSRLS
jgi:hypothetical protein